MAVDLLSARFGALADPTRRAILARLVTGEASLKELAKPFNISPQAVSKHLKVLERAGLSRAVATRDRGLAASHRAHSRTSTIGLCVIAGLRDERFDRLGAYVQQLQAKEKKHGSRR